MPILKCPLLRREVPVQRDAIWKIQLGGRAFLLFTAYRLDQIVECVAWPQGVDLVFFLIGKALKGSVPNREHGCKMTESFGSRKWKL